MVSAKGRGLSDGAAGKVPTRIPHLKRWAHENKLTTVRVGDPSTACGKGWPPNARHLIGLFLAQLCSGGDALVTTTALDLRSIWIRSIQGRDVTMYMVTSLSLNASGPNRPEAERRRGYQCVTAGTQLH